MPDFNQVTLMGHVGQDPEMRYLPSNVAVTSFSLAINEHWKDKGGNKQSRTCWVDCECFGKAGETINQYVTKGSALLVSGKLRQDSWEDKSGNKRSKIKVVVHDFQFIGGKGDDGGGTNKAESRKSSPGADFEGSHFDEADLPF